MGRTAVQLVVAAALLVLLAVLGTLQYRWLGEVSNAERERLRNSLRARAADFSRDFDQEITRAYMAFRVEPGAFDADPAGVLSDALTRAQSESTVGGLVTSVYLVETNGARANQLQRLDPRTRTIAPVEWPADLDAWRQRADHITHAVPGLPPMFMGGAIDASTPALMVSLPSVKRVDNEGRVTIVADPSGAMRTIILRLDADRLKRQLIEALLARHFGTAETSEYYFSVVSRGDSPQTIYASPDDAEVTAANADVAEGLFDLRLDDLTYFTRNAPPPDGRGSVLRKDRLAITIVRRSNVAEASRVLMARADSQGAWQLLIRYKSGSLEAVVAQSRHRNLAIGLGVLGLLAASFIFVIGSAQRQQRLARQQMEFVAAVSHELRTPLAVIRSAGENLADGLVQDGDQVQQYGSLIRTEGRRLSDMVERVMEFAGISSGTPIRARGDVDIARVLDEAAATVQAEARERGVALVTSADGPLPPVAGDAAALRSAVQNVIGNAVKYSPAGARVRVDVDVDDRHVRITVADCGLGIDEADLPHIFKPFYRGRRAVDAQIRGTGVGLSVVRHVVDAHRGEIRVESLVGEGTRVTILLPAAPAVDGPVGDRAEAGATT